MHPQISSIFLLGLTMPIGTQEPSGLTLARRAIVVAYSASGKSDLAHQAEQASFGRIEDPEDDDLPANLEFFSLSVGDDRYVVTIRKSGQLTSLRRESPDIPLRRPQNQPSSPAALPSEVMRKVIEVLCGDRYTVASKEADSQRVVFALAYQGRTLGQMSSSLDVDPETGSLLTLSLAVPGLALFDMPRIDSKTAERLMVEDVVRRFNAGSIRVVSSQEYFGTPLLPEEAQSQGSWTSLERDSVNKREGIPFYVFFLELGEGRRPLMICVSGFTGKPLGWLEGYGK